MEKLGGKEGLDKMFNAATMENSHWRNGDWNEYSFSVFCGAKCKLKPCGYSLFSIALIKE